MVRAMGEVRNSAENGDYVISRCYDLYSLTIDGQKKTEKCRKNLDGEWLCPLFRATIDRRRGTGGGLVREQVAGDQDTNSTVDAARVRHRSNG